MLDSYRQQVCIGFDCESISEALSDFRDAILRAPQLKHEKKTSVSIVCVSLGEQAPMGAIEIALSYDPVTREVAAKDDALRSLNA